MLGTNSAPPMELTALTQAIIHIGRCPHEPVYSKWYHWKASINVHTIWFILDFHLLVSGSQVSRCQRCAELTTQAPPLKCYQKCYEMPFPTYPQTTRSNQQNDPEIKTTMPNHFIFSVRGLRCARCSRVSHGWTSEMTWNERRTVGGTKKMRFKQCGSTFHSFGGKKTDRSSFLLVSGKESQNRKRAEQRSNQKPSIYDIPLNPG